MSRSPTLDSSLKAFIPFFTEESEVIHLHSYEGYSGERHLLPRRDLYHYLVWILKDEMHMKSCVCHLKGDLCMIQCTAV